MKPVILFRKDINSEQELNVAKEYFDVIESRTIIKPNSLVIGRYSVLPYYLELAMDLNYVNSKLANNYQEHCWIANFEWYDELKEFTPETYSELDFYKWNFPGPFVVKGKTNSRKHQWNSHMFAKDRLEALKISSLLKNDMLLGTQDIIIRKYVPLKTFEVGINGLPFTNEWRFFYYKDVRLCYGYYWSIADNVDCKIDDNGIMFADKLAKIVSNFTNFFVLDVAETVDGDWILIEINDGQMSGLSEINPHELYCNLSKLF